MKCRGRVSEQNVFALIHGAVHILDVYADVSRPECIMRYRVYFATLNLLVSLNRQSLVLMPHLFQFVTQTDLQGFSQSDSASNARSSGERRNASAAI